MATILELDANWPSWEMTFIPASVPIRFPGFHDESQKTTPNQKKKIKQKKKRRKKQNKRSGGHISKVKVIIHVHACE